MGPLSDGDIKFRLKLDSDNPKRLSIIPFEPAQVKLIDANRYIGFGLTSYGYDVRLGTRFRKLLDDGGTTDPFGGSAAFGPAFTVRQGDRFTLDPWESVLAETVETFDVPRDCIALVTTKSTWARCFLNLNNTTLEPRWCGTITLELTNVSKRPIALYPGHGIAQVVFFAGTECDVSYADRPEASYNNQSGPTPPRTSKRD